MRSEHHSSDSFFWLHPSLCSFKLSHLCFSHLNVYTGCVSFHVTWISKPGLLTLQAAGHWQLPVVKVWSKPKGLPIARTCCPTLSARELPSVIGRSSA